ncbi:MAG: DNA-3-methyladenine glycosylase I [Sphaerobacteraceae bacterium]|nr:MAG: DNA-3-methyladenine glycosylase I [Sphaerobacteraceae bacterium]
MDARSIPDIDDRPRCGWANTDDLMAYYHDVEWGRQPESDNEYFEALTLESFQSGLSWRTILHRREGFREAFAGFSIPVVASFTEYEVETMLANERIIRHRGKIQAAIHNARAFQTIQQEAGSFRGWLEALPEDPDVIRRALKPRLKFFGPTTCVSFAEAVGKIPTPHDDGCWKYQSAT